MSQQPENIEQLKVRDADDTDETPVGGVTGTSTADIDTEQSEGLSTTGLHYGHLPG